MAQLKVAKVAVMYASAYGNTASLAQAISRGITKAGVGVEMINLEQVSTKEAEEILLGSQGFCIGASLPVRQCALLYTVIDPARTHHSVHSRPLNSRKFAVNQS